MTVIETSKFSDALQQRDIQPRPLPSKSYQPRRRRPSLAPTPSRTPSMSLHRRQPTKPPITDFKVLPRLEEENANLPPQSTEFILAQIERQNAMLDNHPKSVSIHLMASRRISTLQNLTTISKKKSNKRITGVGGNGAATDQHTMLSPTSYTENGTCGGGGGILEEEDDQTDNTEQDTDQDIDWEFWSAMIDDFSGVALKLPHLVSAKLRAGIPSKVRGLIWQAMSNPLLSISKLCTNNSWPNILLILVSFNVIWLALSLVWKCSSKKVATVRNLWNVF
ncbi:unnamed protein product [Absidia cylindrospora]